MARFSPRRKRLYNGLMVAAVVVIFAAAVLAVGSLQGWFAGPSGQAGAASALKAQAKTGNVNIERGGVAYRLEEGDALRLDDTVETLSDSFVTLEAEGGCLQLDASSRVSVGRTDDGRWSASVEKGAVFAEGDAMPHLRDEALGADVHIQDGAVYLSAPAGSAEVHVLAGTATVCGREVPQGHAVSVAEGAGGDVAARPLDIASLGAFEISCLRAYNNQGGNGCFGNDELDALEAQRRARNPDVSADGLVITDGEGRAPAGYGASGESASAPGADGSAASGAARGPATPSSAGRSPNPADSQGGGAQAFGFGASSNEKNPSGASSSAGSGNEDPLTCTLAISCATILDNRANLAPGKDRFVPASGYLLAPSPVAFQDGETVFDVLKRACAQAGIPLEYSWTPAYDSYYVEGIGNIYEFDCGNQSGWMYQVNGWYPNYGCSSYTLKAGDAIQWNYTCNGYGADLGAAMG